MAIDWNAIYEDELKKIEDPTTKLEELKKADIGALDTAKAAEEQKLGQTRDETLRQAYVTREMNKKDLPAIMANMGLTGGITETAGNDLLRDYRNSSNSANKSYNASATDLANAYGVNVANLTSRYGERLLEALQNRTNTATNSANIRAQIQQAEEQAAEARRQFDEEQKLIKEQWEWQKAQAAAAAAAPAASTQIVATGGGGGSTGTSGDNVNPYGSGTGTFAGSGVTSNAMDQSNYAKAIAAQQKTAQQYALKSTAAYKNAKSIYG